MDWKFIFAVFIAFVGSATLNIGKGVQKMKVHVFSQGWGMFKSPYRRDFLWWLAGMGMTASFGPCQWLAIQLVKNPSLPVAMIGVGLVALVVFAVKIIGEKLAPREVTGIVIIIVSTFTLVYKNDPCKNLSVEELEFLPRCIAECTSVNPTNFHELRECCAKSDRGGVHSTIEQCVTPLVKAKKVGDPTVDESAQPSMSYSTFDKKMLLISLGVLLGIGMLLAVFSLTTSKLHGFSFGFLAGSVNGIALTLVKVAALSAGSMALGAQLKGPWLYLAFIFGILATVFTQIGFWRDRALIVVPTYTSLTMMTPAVMEYLVFGFRLDNIQYLSLLFIVVGVVVLCSGAPEAVIAGDFSSAKEEKPQNES